ncbi:hypothetical protein MMC24_004433 [Lignoscripta atroalba]|nr:hypothetical protein [Lignoscripta atroalba]
MLAPTSSYRFQQTLSSPLEAMPSLHPANDATFAIPVEQPRQSPRKQSHPSGGLPKVVFAENMNISLPPPEAQIFTTDSPIKKPLTSTYHPIAPQKPQKALFTTFPSARPMDKENLNPTYHSDNFAEFPDPAYGYKAPGKRDFLEAAPLQNRQPKRPRHEDQGTPQIPGPQDMPHVEDDGTKPPYSYASLIGMSILRSPSRRLTLAQIYKWISDTFSYYRASDTGWQNSIRHNLSLNKAFLKQERPKDDPGKGNYWSIEPGMEAQFAKEKPCRRPASSSGPSVRFLSQPTSEMSSSSSLSVVPSYTSKADAQISEVISGPSSDATIPASDPVYQNEDADNFSNMPPPPATRVHPSSPIQAMHSSPPIARHSQPCDGTPPYAAEFPSSSHQSGSRKRKVPAMNDSGYFSSIESSATRPYDINPEFDTDRRRSKRGRAEEEIARIRSSSHDLSPSKGRASLKQPTPQLVSSSPLRHFDSSLMLPPLTPAATFKIPPKPPASISPNTNLRNHRNKIRELVGSPVRSMGVLSEDIPFSPAFNLLEDESYAFNDTLGACTNIFAENEYSIKSRRSYGSPEKRPIKRPRLDRATTTSSILADITGTSNDNKDLMPSIKAPYLDSPVRQKSPGKSSFIGSNVVDLSKDDFFGLDIFADDDPDDFGGLDILQGLQKIGEKEKVNEPLGKKKATRPLLGTRSFTSRF